MQRTLIFTADDLGLNEETNLAIEQAHQRGVLNAASLMLGQPGSAHALEIIRRNPGLQIGWHFHACDSCPLTRSRWPWGNSPALAGAAFAISPFARALIRRELAAQWHAFEGTGLSCCFINGHHHLHLHPFIAREMHLVVAGSFTGWVRGFGVNFFGANTRGNAGYQWLRRRSVRWLDSWKNNRLSDTLWGLDRTFNMKSFEVASAIQHLPAGWHEFLFHPRKINDADFTALVELRDILSRGFQECK